jgi:Phosphotransferase enzyme family
MLPVASSEAMAAKRRPSVVAVNEPSRDERLRDARRLDWRFFLPAPGLGRVAVAGAVEPDLVAALTSVTRATVAALAAGATGLDPTAARLDPTADGPFDTIVLSGSVTRTDLKAAAAAMAERGHLVIELDGALTPTRRIGRGALPGTSTRIVRSLRAGGFDVVEWLAWPSIARAVAFARADDQLAVQGWVVRRFGPRAGAAIGIASRSALGSSAVAAVAPARVIVARRTEVPASLVEQRLRVDPYRPQGRLILTPRYRASAHIVGLLIGADRTVERVVKIARLRDDASLTHEAAMLATLRRMGGPVSWPLLVDAPGLPTEAGGDAWPILVETGVVGEPLDPPAVRRDRARAAAAIEAWLASLPVDPADTRTIGIGTRLDEALAAIERLDDRSANDLRLAGLIERTRPHIRRLAGVAMPRVFEHGDPAHPNLLRGADGRIAAVDWERGEPDGLPIHDLTIALAYAAAAAAGATRPTDQATAFQAAMTDGDRWAAAALDRDLARLGVDLGCRPSLVVSAWVRSAAWLADQLADSTGTPDVARWLAADRSVALWSAALDLAERA